MNCHPEERWICSSLEPLKPADSSFLGMTRDRVLSALLGVNSTIELLCAQDGDKFFDIKILDEWACHDRVFGRFAAFSDPKRAETY
jgi:hypothetical protein